MALPAAGPWAASMRASRAFPGALTPRSCTIEALAVTALTNFLLASQTFLLCGMHLQRAKARFSASWHWGYALLALGIAALLGGIDHGFIEPAGLPRDWIRELTWLALGFATFFLVQTANREFLHGRLRKALSVVAWVQLLAFSAAVLVVETFLLVVLNYAPAMLLLMLLHIAHYRRERGSPEMIAGIGLLIVASAVQALQISPAAWLSGDGLYHLIAMPAVFLMYLGGCKLKPQHACYAHGEGLNRR